jgi:hypothetical protein
MKNEKSITLSVEFIQPEIGFEIAIHRQQIASRRKPELTCPAIFCQAGLSANGVLLRQPVSLESLTYPLKSLF